MSPKHVARMLSTGSLLATVYAPQPSHPMLIDGNDAAGTIGFRLTAHRHLTNITLPPPKSNNFTIVES